MRVAGGSSTRQRGSRPAQRAAQGPLSRTGGKKGAMPKGRRGARHLRRPGHVASCRLLDAARGALPGAGATIGGRAARRHGGAREQRDGRGSVLRQRARWNHWRRKLPARRAPRPGCRGGRRAPCRGAGVPRGACTGQRPRPGGGAPVALEGRQARRTPSREFLGQPLPGRGRHQRPGQRPSAPRPCPAACAQLSLPAAPRRRGRGRAGTGRAGPRARARSQVAEAASGGVSLSSPTSCTRA